MAVKSKLDLARDVLFEIRVQRFDEDPSPERKAIVDNAYAGLYQELANISVAYWDEEQIPVLVFRPLVKLVAMEIAPVFNKPYEAGDAMQRLYAAAAKPWSGKVVKTVAY